jgi:serine protease
MGYITLFVKHPHGTMTTIPFVNPPPPPSRLARGGRRPVVALFDSAVGTHSWLKPPTVLTSLALPEPTDETAADSDSPPSPAAIEITQHGTFDAGVLRQFAPDADIMSVSIMGASGLIEPLDVRRALLAIRDRDASSEPESFVDIVCLPLGYVQGRATPEHMEAEKKLLDELAALGVLVVAAAGNLGTDELVYPAAFADQRPPVGPPVLSVGALDQNGTRADYSSHGPWVKHWEVGLVDSIVAEPPEGYASGEGTSFAATTVAAKLAMALRAMDNLNDVTTDATIARATAALTRVLAYS